MIVKTKQLSEKYNHQDGIKLLSEILKKEFNISRFELIYNENGKPFFKDIDNLFFSISHTDDVIVCVVNDKEVGIDIEKVINYNKKINDILRINSKNNVEFFKEWTKREAYIKLKGLALKNINDDYSGCKLIVKEYKNYIITIAEEI